ncbi:MAG: site-specific DNA-methyltransferase [Candidatus Sumerlaeales bacterium]|nr:site-specific DNA-methyltransferase [Candidatus Sumerlaeales bacterium]
MQLYRDHFQNYKRYNIPKAQLIIADIPYNIGVNAYASSPSWYKDGDNNNGESALAKTSFFDTDNDFRVPEFMHFCNTMLKKEPKEAGQAGCMIVFCEFEQQFMLVEEGRKYGLMNYINLVFRKNYSAQVLKANMKIVGNCEYAVLLYRNKLPKFNNNGKMVFNCMDYARDNETPKIHPTQKSIIVLKNLISIFTDIGDVVIDPVAGSGTTLLAAEMLGRKSYGFEIKKEYVDAFNSSMAANVQTSMYNLESEKVKESKREKYTQIAGVI